MTKYYDNGQYELVKLTITTNSNTPIEIDIHAIMYDMTIYESLFNDCISGNISIVDADNLVREVCLGNFEKIHIEFNTAGVDEVTKLDVICYKVGPPYRMSDHASGHILYFASEEMFSSLRSKEFSGYNEEVSLIVTKLYEKLKRVDSPKPLDASKTKNIENFVFTGQELFKAISMAALKAVSVKEDTGYVFYEDMDKFNFKSLEELYQQEPVIEYVYKNSSVFEDVYNRHEEAFNSYQDYEILEGDNIAQKVMDGQYGSTWQNFTLATKSLEVYNYTASQAYNSAKSLGQYPYPTNKNVSSSFLDKLFLSYTNSPNSLIPIVNAKMNKLRSNSVVISIGVFGNSKLRVGNVCKANIPNWSKNGMQPTGADRDVLTGKFLIAEIKHVFTQKLYTQRIKIVKDAFEGVIN